MLQIEKGENNTILRKKSIPIKSTSPAGSKVVYDIKKLADNMLEIMKSNNGIGLSACQIGKNIRIFVLPRDLSEHWVFVNPKIIKKSKKTETIEEGCLSLPNIFVPVERSKSLKIKALDENCKPFKLKAKDLLARVIQHETDHLNGVLITDYE